MQNCTIRRWLPALLAAAMFVPACTNSGEESLLSIEATGTVFGRTFLDRDGNGTLEPADGSVAGIGIGLLLGSGRDTAAAASTASDGSFTLDRIPVGDYRLVVDSATVPDSLRLIEIDSARLTLGVEDTIAVLVELTYPTVSVDSARALREGTTVFVEGIALHDGGIYGDETMHLADGTGAIRLTRVRDGAGIRAGDSIRVRGTRSQQQGQPTLHDAVLFVLGTSPPPEPIDTLNTATAASADGGRLDAALIRIANATVHNAETTLSGELRLSVDDGSGTLAVAIDPDTGIDLEPSAGLVGATLDATGVLVPAEDIADTWRLRPRSNDDLAIEPAELNSTAAAGSTPD